MRVAGRFLSNEGRGGGRAIRDLHNDGPKSVACAADMLLSASMASGRKQIGYEQTVHGASLSFHIKWPTCGPGCSKAFTTDFAGCSRENSLTMESPGTRLASAANIGNLLCTISPSPSVSLFACENAGNERERRVTARNLLYFGWNSQAR